MVQALQALHLSRLSRLVGLPTRDRYYMAFLPGKTLPEPEPVILSYADYTTAIKRDKPVSTDRAK